MIINNGYRVFLLIACITFASSSIIYTQEKIKVHAKGTSISRDLTPKEAKEEAIKDAQKNAYLKAGIEENITLANFLYTNSDGESVNQYFNELSSIESNANIIIDSVYPEKSRFDEYLNMIVDVEIDATVFMYHKEKDPTLFFKIDGLKDTYYADEKISFSFSPSQNGYLKIFSINDSDLIMLYPYINIEIAHLRDKPDSLFQKSKTVAFPLHPAYKPGYSIELSGSNKTEVNTLIFVYTKDDIPWLEKELTFKSILKWIYNIPIDRREIKTLSIVLKHL